MLPAILSSAVQCVGSNNVIFLVVTRHVSVELVCIYICHSTEVGQQKSFQIMLCLFYIKKMLPVDHLVRYWGGHHKTRRQPIVRLPTPITPHRILGLGLLGGSCAQGLRPGTTRPRCHGRQRLRCSVRQFFLDDRLKDLGRGYIDLEMLCAYI